MTAIRDEWVSDDGRLSEPARGDGETMTIEQTRKSRGITAKVGGRVRYTGSADKRPVDGTIVGSRQGYLQIKLDGDSHAGLYHPTWELEFLPRDQIFSFEFSEFQKGKFSMAATATAVATESSFEMDLPADMGSDTGPAVLSLHREPPEAANAAELLEGGDVAETDEEIIDLDFATPAAAAEQTQAASGSTSEGQRAAEPTAEPDEIIVTATKAVDAHVIAEKRRKAYLREKDVLQEHISALMIEQMKLREQAKQCKKEAEVYIEKLNSLIDAWENPDDDSPMDADADAGAGDSGQDGKALAGGCVDIHDDRDATDQPRTEPVSQPGEVASQDRYQAVLEAAAVTELDLPAKLLGRLQEAGATTVWRLEKLRGEIALGREKWPKGVGEAKVTAIEDALMKWMSAHQESWDAAEAGPLDAEVAAGGAVDPEFEAAVEAVAPAPTPTIDDL